MTTQPPLGMIQLDTEGRVFASEMYLCISEAVHAERERIVKLEKLNALMREALVGAAQSIIDGMEGGGVFWRDSAVIKIDDCLKTVKAMETSEWAG